MKICVLGGFGTIGRKVVAKILANSDKEVVVADRIDKDPELVFPGQQERLEYIKIDAFNVASIQRAVSHCKIAINCVGPHYRYGILMAKAIIDSGVDGIDLCNDSSSMPGILALDSYAKERKVSFLTGLGFSPGLSNLFVLKSIQKLDTITSIDINWTGDILHQAGKAQLDHFLYLANEKTSVYRNGLRFLVPLFSEAQQTIFAWPFGEMEVSQIGSPEIITLPEYISVENINVKGAIIPNWIQKSIKYSRYSGLTKDVSPRNTISGLLYKTGQFFSMKSVLNGKVALQVRVKGQRNGVNVAVQMDAVDYFASLVALSVATGAFALARGEVYEKGVFPPEGCLNENRFLTEISRLGLVYTISENFSA
ncbi:MAG: saccharopine dehydrogenase NADP-binding domain-containing protein [Deltaproteobacteria bacterium]|jgi:saccharopine dehydrogenase-like NADP-dependent oxidoreductase|nr:saccharopine dehydrogenase NADP-binding domain-containing protein [Deltaproteobacteria bacterium]